MKKIFQMAIIIAVAMAFAPVKAQEQPYIDMNTTVEREVTPDEIFLRITIDENDYKGKKTLEQMQKSLLEVLRKSNVDAAEALSLNYMGSEVGYKLFSKDIKPKTEAVYTLKLYDVITMQKVIESLENVQITNILLAKTKYTKEEELKRSMSIDAMRQAQAEARVLAGAVEQQVGKAISISSWISKGETAQPRLYKSRSVSNDAMDISEEQTSQISIAKITYRFNVSVRFELK
ncbi:MAG: SIMPL domain-containing protein [Bacteroidaceae bacterium]|nr:SIMPL domain-containing protein [Bacteroidaceae bacterium]